MKANRKFREADEAVSPVIGVILMVAITVVLAAVVFVLVSDLGGESNSAPAISWSQKENTDRLEVTSASSSADWSRLSVSVSSCTQTDASSTIINAGNAATDFQNTAAAGAGADLNAAAATGTSCGAAAAKQVAGSVDAIGANDYVEFCASTEATNVVIVLTDTVANSKVGEWTFSTIAVCS